MTRSTLQQAAEMMAAERLDVTLGEWVRERRPGSPWRMISDELRELIGVGVTYESLRNWYPDPVLTKPGAGALQQDDADPTTP